MNCNITRSQKARANERQKNILSAITEYSKKEHEYGEYYMMLDFINKLYDLGIEFFESREEKDLFLNMLLFGEAMRIWQIKHQQQTDNTQEYEYNTDNIYVGQVVKNYKELCRLLEVKPKTGKSRQLQEKDFFRYFDYEKLKYSQEYVILDIYDEPLKKNEQAKNSLYCNALKLIIMYDLSKELSEEKAKDRYFVNDENIVYSIETTYNSLISKLELLSIFFDKDITDFLIDKYLQLTNQDITDINRKNLIKKLTIYKRVLRRRYKGHVDYALKRLKEQNIIHYDSYSVIVENGKKRQATFDEEVLIENAKREAAKQLGYKNANLASLYDKKAYNKALESIYHNKYRWSYVFNQIQIGANQKMLNTPINEYTNYSTLDFSVFELPDTLRERYKQLYINNVRESSLRAIKKKSKTEKEKVYDDFGSNTEFDLFGIAPDRFINDIDNELALQQLFIDYLIKPNDTEIAEYYDYCDT